MSLTAKEHQLLIEALQSGTIALDALGNIEMIKRNKVIDIHNYKISQPGGKTQRWMTYVPDPLNGRKKVSAPTEESLYRKLYDIYFDTDTITVELLYPEWLDKRKGENLSDRTIQRNINYWNKYYADHSIVKKKVHKVTFEDIENFFNEKIREHDLTAKEFINMKIVLVDIFKLAKRRKLIQENPFKYVEVKTSRCRPPKKRADSERVFMADEKERIFRVLNKEIAENPELTDGYAIFILFKLGLRLGEVVALKFSDIDYDSREIHIHRMETKHLNDEERLTRVVVNHTKKKSIHGDRFLPLSQYEIDIFKRIQEINERNGYGDQDFVFCDENGRTPINAIEYYIKKICRLADVQNKSAHDIRRTVASEMFNNNIPIQIIRDYLGHSVIETTWGYVYNNLGKRETSNKIFNSLDDLNGLVYHNSMVMESMTHDDSEEYEM